MVIWPVAGSVRSKSGEYVLKEISCDKSSVVAPIEPGKGAGAALGVSGWAKSLDGDSCLGTAGKVARVMMKK